MAPNRPVRDRFEWQGRILQKAWADTARPIRAWDRYFEFAIVAACPVVAFVLQGPSMTWGDVGLAVASGWGGLAAVFCSAFVWNYMWTPFRMDRDQRRELEGGALQLDVYAASVRARPDAVDGRAVFYLTVVNDSKEIAYPVEVSITVHHNRTHAEYQEPRTLKIAGEGSGEVYFEPQLPLDDEEFNEKIRVTGTVGHAGRVHDYCFKYKPWRGDRPSGIPQFIPCDTSEARHFALVVSDGIRFGSEGGVRPSTPDTEALLNPESAPGGP